MNLPKPAKKIGLVIGRFQPFHKGHLDMIQQVMTQVDYIKIAIGSSNKKRMSDNPLSYMERKKYISSILPFKNYTIYPSPDTPNDNDWLEHLVKRVGDFDIAFITDNSWTEKIFQQHAIPYQKTRTNIPVSGTMVREYIRTKNKKIKNALVIPLPQNLQYAIEST